MRQTFTIIKKLTNILHSLWVIQRKFCNFHFLKMFAIVYDGPQFLSLFSTNFQIWKLDIHQFWHEKGQLGETWKTQIISGVQNLVQLRSLGLEAGENVFETGIW